MNADLYFARCLELAEQASAQHEVPIGAVLVKDGQIVAQASNQTESKNSFLAHAEMICLQQATEKLGSKYLNDCELYVSLEPCLMCLTAARLSRISAVHYLLASEKFGEKGLAYFSTQLKEHNHPLRERALLLLRSFFSGRR